MDTRIMLSAMVLAVAGLMGGSALAAMPDKTAPDFSLLDQKGNNVKLSDFKGQIVVLEWTNPDCMTVQRLYRDGSMQKLAKSYTGKGVIWLAINSSSGSSSEMNSTWANKEKISYAVLDDHEGSVAEHYGVTKTPEMFVIDRNGDIVYHGALDNDASGKRWFGVENYVSTALDSLLHGKSVAIIETRPYGCALSSEASTGMAR